VVGMVGVRTLHPRAAADHTSLPDEPQVAAFRRRCVAPAGRELVAAEELHRWSVDHFREFWATFLDWSDLTWEGAADIVCTSDDVETARFFPDVRLNYAENLLRPLPAAGDDAPAVTSLHDGRPAERMNRGQLRAAVQRTAAALAHHGIGPEDRVVAIAPNGLDAMVVALAVASVGATLSTASPDMGASALLSRFAQVEPTILVVDRTRATGNAVDPADVLTALLAGLPALRQVVVLDELPLPAGGQLPHARLTTLLADVPAVPASAEWPRFPFDHPLWVMFSSGTTGAPKAMVHGAGGSLLEHVKEHRLHCDLRPGDTLYFHTSTAWMMWNWQLSALASGVHVVLHDGPVTGPDALWDLVSAHRVTVFGTSPAYLQLCQDAGVRPADAGNLGALRAVLSTGAVLHDWQFDWVAETVGPVPVQSISGGTDLVGCFVLGHPEQPVRTGRAQSLGLGLDVVAVDEDGRPVLDAVGELVCRRPFPSRPVRFLADPEGRRFHSAYFDRHQGVWTHGDLIEIAADGSSRLHGRVDGVLNVDGVRIGPTEIHAVVRRLPGIAGAMAVEQRDPAGAGRTRLVLLVTLRPGCSLDDVLVRAIRSTLRRDASPAHVPSVVLAVPELPTTHSGKHSERAARDALNGDAPHGVDALRNPGSLAVIAAAAAAHDARAAAGPVHGGPYGPGDDLDAAVARIFCAAVGADVGEDVDFFDAGGTSRQSMALIRRLRSELDRPLPLESFAAAPTIRGLREAMRAPAELVPPVQQLRGGATGARPLYLVQGAYGDCDDFRHVLDLLPAGLPLHGLVEPLEAADGSRKPLTELAADHVRTLARHQPDGPLALLGYSFGALLAYEMARQLAAAGRTISFLGLVDAQPPQQSLGRLGRLVKRTSGLLAAVVPGVERRGLRQAVLDNLRPRRTQAYGKSVHGRSRATYAAYRWAPYDGRLTFFRARRRIPVLMHQLYAWRRVAPRMTVVDVPGNHYELLRQGHAEVLARELTAALAQAGIPARPSGPGVGTIGLRDHLPPTRHRSAQPPRM